MEDFGHPAPGCQSVAAQLVGPKCFAAVVQLACGSFIIQLPRSTVEVVRRKVILVASRSVMDSRVVSPNGVSCIHLRRAWCADRRCGSQLCRWGRKDFGQQDPLHLPAQCLLLPAVSLHEFLRTGGDAHCFLHVFWGRSVHPLTIFWQQFLRKDSTTSALSQDR